MLAPHVNTHDLYTRLSFIREAARPYTHVVPVLGHAGWHLTMALMVLGNLSLRHLPPFSQRLNSVDRDRSYQKIHCFSNRIYHDCADLLEAVKQSWHQVSEA